MNQEKSVNFSVIKQKIIKTDEVLRLYLETNNKLKSIQETCKGIKLKYDQTVCNLNRIQLENERCTFNLENVKLKCELLEKENGKLREQKLILEDKYNHQTVQSQLNIKELEDQLKMLQEMKMAAHCLSPKKRKKLSTINEDGKKFEDKIKRLEESEINGKNEIKLLNVQNKKLSNDIIMTEKKHADTVKKLQDERSNLLIQLNELKSQINTANMNLKKKSKHETSLENLSKEKDREISELQKKIFTLINDENKINTIEEENEMLKKKIVDQKINSIDAKENICTKDACFQTDEVSKKHTRSIRVQTQETMKTLPQQDLISRENRKLKQTILDRDGEIFKLKARSKVQTNHCHTQTEVVESDAESVDDILVEMRMPFSMLSPMSSCENHYNISSPIPGDSNDIHSASINIPDIFITPPTPTVDKHFETFTDLHETPVVPTNDENSSVEQSDLTNADNKKNSEDLENKEIRDKFQKVPRRRKYQSSFISNDFVKLRKSCLKRMLNKRYMFKKEMRRVRKLSRQDCILKALRTLKHSNINFTISNESNVPKWCTNYNNYDSFKHSDLFSKIDQQKENMMRKTSILNQKYKSTQYTEQLKCNFKNCNNGNSCMLLNNVQGVTELLGFFSVKNENITPSSSRLGNIVDNKHLMKSLHSATRDSKITPENLLETLADLVSQKLRENRNVSKRKQKPASDKSDSFHSDTETEIERLFATPDDSVLTRNKMLLKKAKQENLQEASFTSSLEENVSGSQYAGIDDESLPLKLTQNSAETEISRLDVASWIEHKKLFNITQMNPANESSTYTLDISKTTVKLPSAAKSVEKCPSALPEPICNESADSCDSFQYSECPELLSPLNSVNGSPRSKGTNILFQCNEKFVKENEQILIEMPPPSRRCLKFSKQQNNPDGLNDSQDNIKSITASPVSTSYINKYIRNEKVMSEQISTFISNFEKHDGSIEKSPYTSNSYRNTPNKNDWCGIFKTEQKVENSDLQDVSQTISPIKNQSTFSFFANLSLKESQEILPKFSGEGAKNSNSTESNHATSFSSLPNISTAPTSEEYGNIDRNNSTRKEFMNYRQSEHNIPLNDSEFPVQYELSSSPIEDINREVISVLSVAENSSNSISELDEIGEITSCPQSPVNDFEEHLDIKIPKIIPLEKVFEQNTIELDISGAENIPLCDKFSKQDTIKATGTKIIASTNYCDEQLVISKALPKEKRTPSYLSKTSESENIANRSASPIHVTCLPSPLNISESQFLEECGKFRNNIDSKDVMKNKQHEHSISLNHPMFPVNHELSNIVTTNIDREILDVLPDAENTPNGITQLNEIEDIRSCPQSPVNDCEEHVDVKIPKIIPLESEQGTIIGLDISSAENIPSSDEVSKQDAIKTSATKIRAFTNDCHKHQLEKGISLVSLPKGEGTPSHLPKTSKFENIANYSELPFPIADTCLPSPINISEAQLLEEYEKFDNTDSKELMKHEQSKHNISLNDSMCSVNRTLSNSQTMNITREILDVLPNAENTPNGIPQLNEIEDIESCPQSPVNDCEEHVDIEIPKIIPLERQLEHDSMICLESNSTENMPSYKLLKQKETATNVESFNNDRNEQSDALPKEENTSSYISNTNKIDNIASCPELSVRITRLPSPLNILMTQFPKKYGKLQCNDDSWDFKEHKQYELDISPDGTPFPVNNELLCSPIKIITREILHVLPDVKNDTNSMSVLNEIDDITSCPQSPINDSEEHNMDIEIPRIIPLERSLGKNTMIGSDANSTDNVPSSHEFPKQDDSIKVSETKIITCPMSPVGEELIVIPPKTIPLEKLDEKDITGDIDKKNSAGDTSIRSKSPELNDECDKHILSIINNRKCDSENIALDFANNKEYQTTNCSKTTASYSPPMTLRRSKRISKKIRYSEISSQNSDESCEIVCNRELTCDSKSEGAPPNSSGIVSEISMPTKRKRGRPKKQPIVSSKYEETKTVSVGNTNSTGELLHSKKSCHEETLEKILTKNENKDLKELSEKGNSIENLCVERVGSDMVVDEFNSELKSDVILGTTSDNAHNEMHHKFVTDHTYAKKKNVINNVVRKKQVDNEGVVRNGKNTTCLISPASVTSDMASEGKSPTNEFYTDLIINETNCEEIIDKSDEEDIDDKSSDEKEVHETKELDNKCNDEKKEMDKANLKEVDDDKINDEKGETNFKEIENNGNEEKDEINCKEISDRSCGEKEDIETNSTEIDDKSINEKEDINKSNSEEIYAECNDELVVKKSPKIDTDIFKKISNIIFEEKRIINLSERNVQPSDPLISGTHTEKIIDKNNEVGEKLVSKNAIRKRKPMSTLKSNIIKQFRIKRKMFQMDVEPIKKSNTCDLKTNPTSDRNNVKNTNIKNINSKSNMTQGTSSLESTSVDNKRNSCDSRKIHIVQNILIPANSSYAVDLMEKQRTTYSPFSSNCDIYLDTIQSSSQSDVKQCNPPPLKKKNAASINDNEIPLKRRRTVPVKSKNTTNGDILSQILGEMDKDRPNNTVKPIVAPSIPKQAIPTSIEDNEWRKGIMTIAESMYNVADERDGFKQPVRPGNQQKKRKPSTKERILMSRLSKLSTEDNIPDEIIVEFKRQTVDNIAEIILQRVSQDTMDKADDKYYPAPLMTKTQRILLGLMVRLERENVPNVMNTFLSKADTLLFATGCGIKVMIPITRLYLAVCRLQADINKMRNFCCDAFYFMGNLAIPLLFTVLTSWMEVLPKEPNLKYYPLAKVLVQIVHLKGCNTPGYNCLPLRSLLHQYHEYPKERWNCDELFEELYHQYIKNPTKSTALRLLCKSKEMKWTYRKVNEYLKPLVYKIPEENVNYRATVIVLIGDICSQHKPKNKSDIASWSDLQWWLNGLIEGEESTLIEESVNYSLRKLRRKRKRLPDVHMKIVDKNKNRHEEVEKKVNEMQF